MLGWTQEWFCHTLVPRSLSSLLPILSQLSSSSHGWIEYSPPSLSAGHGLLLLIVEEGKRQEAMCILELETAQRKTSKEGRLLGGGNIDLKSSHAWQVYCWDNGQLTRQRDVMLHSHVKIHSAGRRMVVFNRVPKTGSLGILNLPELRVSVLTLQRSQQFHHQWWHRQ